MSDWSYEYAPDYDRAASLYRQALAQPDLQDCEDVQDRLDDLQEERAHPEQRERRPFPEERDCCQSILHRLAPLRDQTRTRACERRGHALDSRSSGTPHQSMCTTSEALVG
jgi:hypothetical protein